MSIRYTPRDLQTHDALGLLIRDKEGKFLCVYHNKFCFWTIPLGKAEEGQSPEDAVRAEAKEECAIQAKAIKKVFQDTRVYEREGNHIVVFFYLFEVLDFEGDLYNAEPTKHRDMRYLTVDELRKLEETSDATKMLLHCIDNLRIYA